MTISALAGRSGHAARITGISLANHVVATGAATGSVISPISITMSVGVFTGVLSVTGTNAANFQIIGSNLATNAAVGAGPYSINIVATQNSTFTQAITITVGVASISAAKVHATWGANIHMAQGSNTVYQTNSNVTTALNYVRASIARDQFSITTTQAQALITAGLKLCMQFPSGFTTTAQCVTACKTIWNLSPGCIAYLEGPNEPYQQGLSWGGITLAPGASTTWVGVANCQSQLYAAFKADSVLGTAGANIPVLQCTTLGDEWDNVGMQFLTTPSNFSGAMPANTVYADAINLHIYDNPAGQFVGPAGNPGGDNYLFDINTVCVTTGRGGFSGYASATVALALPKVTSEFGYPDNTPSGTDTAAVDRNTAAKNGLNAFLDGVRLGYQGVWWYDLIDDTGQTGDEAGYGLFTNSLVAKPVATIFQKFFDYIQDSTLNAACSVTYTITGGADTLYSFVASKGTGTVFLVVWNEALNWTAGTPGSPIVVGNTTLTITFGTTFSTIEVYDPWLNAVQKTVTNTNTLTATVNDHAIILQLVP